MPDRFIILLVQSTAATWMTLIMGRDKPSGQVEVADVGEQEGILVGEHSTHGDIIFFSIVMSLIDLHLLLIGFPGMTL